MNIFNGPVRIQLIQAVIHPSGTQEWYLDGQLHREDGPAVIHPSGYQAWYLNGQVHRDDGPAIISPDGTQVWYLNGIRIDPAGQQQ